MQHIIQSISHHLGWVLINLNCNVVEIPSPRLSEWSMTEQYEELPYWITSDASSIFHALDEKRHATHFYSKVKARD